MSKVPDELVEKCLSVIDSVADGIKGTGKWTIKTVIDLGQEIVKEVEKLSFAISLSSDEKIDLAVAVLDKKVKLPFYLEIFDGPVFKFILEAIIKTLNKYTGKDWLVKIEAKEVVS